MRVIIAPADYSPQDVRGCRAGGVSGVVPRSLAPDTPLRGPRVAVGRLFELACPAVHPPRLEEGLEGRMVGILGGAGVCRLPPPKTHSRRQLSGRQLRSLRIPPRPTLSAGIVGS